MQNDYECVFDSLPGVFTTTHFEVQGRGALIIVHQGDRSFALNRSSLKFCQRIVDSHTEPLTPP